LNDLLVPRSDVGEFRKRFKWMALVAFLAFGAITVRLFQLQVLSGAAYQAIAHDNIVRRVSLPTTRGVIRDALGKVLASSRASYSLYVVPGRVMPSARPVRPGRSNLDEGTDTWPHIADLLRLNPEDRGRFDARIRSACTSDEDKSPCWRPILVKEDLSRDLVAEVRQHESDLVGSEIVNVPVRYYPYKTLAAHTMGYTSEIDSETLKKYRPDDYESMSPEEKQRINPLNYEPGDVVGATGVEHAWESYLRGQRGWEKRVVDARGRYRIGPDAERLLDPPVRQDPLPGRDLRLTIDIELEQAVEKAFRGLTAGAAVVVDVRTGRLLALYSKPDFDLNDVSGAGGRQRTQETFNTLFDKAVDSLHPIIDRTISGSFQPGSTFKPFSALAALEGKVVDPEDHVRCDGYIPFGRRQIFKCAHVHGKVNLHEAIAESCNIYFANLAKAATMDPIARVAADFGLGQKTGLGTNPEAPGRVPTKAWFALRYPGKVYLDGHTINSAIGQGADTATPLQVALAYAALGNGGTLYQPQVVRAVETSEGAVAQDFPPRVRHKVSVKPENLAIVNDALYAVVNDPKGTAYPARDPILDVSGKTGTAQTTPLADKDENGKSLSVEPKKLAFFQQNHAWFAAYSPSKAPEIAVAVLIEHGGSGPTVAVPTAMQIIRDYDRITAVRAGRQPPAPKPTLKKVASRTPTYVTSPYSGATPAVVPAGPVPAAPSPPEGELP
jgi:penicillin-binding protein 2